MSVGPLSAEFLAHLDEALRDAYGAYPALEERLSGALAEARMALPQLRLSPEAFLRHLASHAPAAGDPEDAFSHLHPIDLYLALGCRTGERAALDAFEARYGADIDAAVRRFAGPDLPPEDLRQALHEKLFVGKSGAQPKIGDYAGQGFLQNWVRITAVRAFTDIVRGAGRRAETPRDDFTALADDDDDLELAFLKQRYRSEFKQAFEQAVDSLESAERNLLRHQVIGGLGIDQIAAVYGIHRATAARRLVRARDALLSRTRESLMQRLSIDRAELDSLMELIQSRLEVSIQRVLANRSRDA
jgi:RNA polymerase sigma-70 factor (ECF subfamily)